MRRKDLQPRIRKNNRLSIFSILVICVQERCDYVQEKTNATPSLCLLIWCLFYYRSLHIYLLSRKSSLLGKGSKKKSREKYGLLPNPGGGSPRVMKKPNCFFGKVFFQWACRIILGPPKHVLHLVWSAYIISTAIRAALKIARRSQILGKRRPVLKRKFDCFWNGTKRKICFSH